MAVILVGASLWVHDNPSTQTVVVTSLGAPGYTIAGVPEVKHVHKKTVTNQSLADQRARYLRFAVLAVGILTLASIPLLRERERRLAAL